MHERGQTHSSSKRQPEVNKQAVQNRVPSSSHASILQLQGMVGNKAVQRMMIGSSVIQTMKWPAKKQQASLVSEISEDWGELESGEVQAFYEWCTTKEQFNLVPKGLSYGQWNVLKAVCTGAKFDELGFSGDQSAKNVIGIFDYLTNKPVVAYHNYDKGSYKETNDELAGDITSIQTEGKFDLTQIKLLDKTLAFELIEADMDRHAAAWEKVNNEGLSKEKIISLNQRIKSSDEKIIAALQSLKSQHEVWVSEQKAKAKKQADIHGAVMAAESAYKIKSSSPLTQKIWNSTKTNAGVTGYLEIGGSYSAANLATAHNEWRRFGQDYNDSLGAVDYLQNIHSPGLGVAQDKLGHNNYDSRSCRYQMDFISDWGGNRTVMHVGLQGTEK